MTIRVRVDDYPHTSRREPQHTREAFLEFHRVLSDGIGRKRYLLGVVPGQCTAEDLLLLRRETDCAVGMHGTDHDEDRLTRNGGCQFEPYLTVKQVAEDLAVHRSALEGALGQPVRVYIPPRNVITGRDVEALNRGGFEWFTTGPESESWAVVHRRSIHSQKPHEYGRSDEMLKLGSHRVLRESSQEHVLTLHWTWEVNIGLHNLTDFLAEIPSSCFRDFDA